ncbi:NAD-dependent epimerase/dehydratase family protein [Pseudotenacibaculum haliotis]|uniref:NAD-dependent epimerase/dehydratase family protein n=1 Tax=Pseudotenacibaculum haliotis TaxID=1862138 RepID=A0ABW5LRR6_9FLAO
MKRVIVTGSTGMVGKGVLLECLESPYIAQILVVNRSSVNIKHPKLKEVLLNDFMQIDTVFEELKGYDACFHCMGVSAMGMSEVQYTHVTYDMTKKLVDILFDLNPEFTFNYVSGTGTDSTEKGRTMWARVKGKTENMIFTKGFLDAYAFRPGAIVPEKGIKSRTSWYQFFYIILRPFFPLMKRSKNITTTTNIGIAMIRSILEPIELKILFNKDINALATKEGM